MSKEQLITMLDKNVEILFNDGTVERGKLGYTPTFGTEYGYKKPHCYTIGDISFKASHVKTARVLL